MKPTLTEGNSTARDLVLMVLLCEGAGRASQVLLSLKEENEPAAPGGMSSAVLVRGRAGETHIFETGYLEPSHIRYFGTLMGALLEGLRGPLDVSEDRMAEEAAAAAHAAWRSMGLDVGLLTALRERFRPGGSALVVLGDHSSVDQLRALSEFDGELLQQPISADVQPRFASRTDDVGRESDDSGQAVPQSDVAERQRKGKR
jgi:hypothetical protein